MGYGVWGGCTYSICLFPDCAGVKVLDCGQVGTADITVCNLLHLVAALNQTVIDEQKTDSMIAV